MGERGKDDRIKENGNEKKTYFIVLRSNMIQNLFLCLHFFVKKKRKNPKFKIFIIKS
jgi:hypothetical protein